MIWRLHSQIEKMNQAKQTATVHGCINDCLYLRPVPSGDFATDADVEMLAQQVQVLLDSDELKYYDDSPMFKIERTKHDEIALADAPEVTWRWNFPRPKLSRWKPDSWNDPLIATVKMMNGRRRPNEEKCQAMVIGAPMGTFSYKRLG